MIQPDSATVSSPGLTSETPRYPFAALVGVPDVQLALLLVAIDPTIGGVLIRGPRGTAKSTAARALADLLPGAPFVQLPLGATLEQLVGTLELQDALRDGRIAWRPGLLARAHGGVLYVDEVNLLPDALADVLLDAAASGVHTVERDGISQRHAARFALIGTMNPEEGELRPQLLDRFGLCVELSNPSTAAARAAIVRARLAFEADPAAFVAVHHLQQQALRQRLQRARQALGALIWSDEIVAQACALALQGGADGLRGDLTLLKAARAHAAWQGKTAIEFADLQAVAPWALAHRRGGVAQAGAQDAASAITPPWQSAPPQRTSAALPDGAAPQASKPQGPLSSHAEAAGEADWGALPPQPVGVAPPLAQVPGGWPTPKP
ncbi:Magnesium-chelatase 38 kDa subunit [Tepidimonas alkaliphilus]|uniref:Magnesium-chelatase 38 kDa subunit n=1 Tax=Tepidimonas alkaliphilus TaxID=2588942 RepID=A0A554WDC6_9BURK|nr:Magnesium-chelatase 38 kDa subunit [Tepidimonas alkaliphilus]